MKMIAELNTDNFDQTIAAATVPVAVDFYAPWCGPCKMLSPLLETLAGQFDGRVRFFKVNVDNAAELAMRFEITGVPTLLLFRDGRLCDSIIGLPSPRALGSKLDAMAVAGQADHAEGSACCH